MPPLRVSCTSEALSAVAVAELDKNNSGPNRLHQGWSRATTDPCCNYTIARQSEVCNIFLVYIVLLKVPPTFASVVHVSVQARCYALASKKLVRDIVTLVSTVLPLLEN